MTVDAVIVLGAGGHAKVVIELLRASENPVAFCIGLENSADYCLDVPVLKGDYHISRLRQEGYYKMMPAIGENNIRMKLAMLALDQGFQLINAVSPHALISPSGTLGQGIAIMAGAIINAASYIGDFSIINTGAVIDHDCFIGPGVHIGPQSAIAGNVRIEEGSFLGVGCKVIPEIRIGSHSVIGAGAVVIENIPNNSVAVGVPAKIRESR